MNLTIRVLGAAVLLLMIWSLVLRTSKEDQFLACIKDGYPANACHEQVFGE